MNYLDLIPDGVLIVDRDCTLVYANKSALDFMDLPWDKVVGAKCREVHRQFSAPCSIPDVMCPHERVIDRGKSKRAVYICKSPDGQERIFAVSYFPVKNDQGDVVQVMEVLRDVTGTEKTKAEIRREAYAHDIIGSLSEEYLRDGGLSVGLSLTAKKIKEFFKPDYIEILLPDKEEKELVLESGDGWDEAFTVPINAESVEGFVYLNDKSVRTLDISKEDYLAGDRLKKYGVKSGLWLPIPTEDSAVVIGVGGICYKNMVDIPASEIWVLEAILKDLSVYIRKERILTELKQSKDFVSSILEGIGDGVVVIDRAFRIVNANKGYLNQVNQAREEILGKHCYEISHHIDRPCYLAGEECSVKQAFETGSSRRIIHTHFDKDNNPVYIETVSYPLKDSLGNVVSAIEVLTDVSERVGLESEIQKRVKELEDFYEIAVDRELKMKELKEELETLKSKVGKSHEST
jgi:PAS domain S-box-containing protein